jgi:multidrug transporter EmrE-like cation transporter
VALSLARVMRGSLSGFLVLSRSASGAAIGALVGIMIAGEGANVLQPLVIGFALIGVIVATALVGWRGHGGKRGLPRAFAVVALAIATFVVTFQASITALPLATTWKLAVGAGVLVAAALGVWLLEPAAAPEEASEAPNESP